MAAVGSMESPEISKDKHIFGDMRSFSLRAHWLWLPARRSGERKTETFVRIDIVSDTAILVGQRIQ